MFTEAQLGYLAGVIDGEGHVLIKRHGVGLVLCMADLPIMEWCCDTFGGSLSGKWKPPAGNSRPRRMWHLTMKRGLEEVARALLPYLVLKRREVEILIEAIEHKRVKPGNTSHKFPTWAAEQDEIIARGHEAMLARKISPA